MVPYVCDVGAKPLPGLMHDHEWHSGPATMAPEIRIKKFTFAYSNMTKCTAKSSRAAEVVEAIRVTLNLPVSTGPRVAHLTSAIN